MALDLSCLPSLAPAAASLANRLAATRWDFARPWGHQEAPVDLAIRFAPIPSPRGPFIRFAVETDFGLASVHVEVGLIDFLSDILLPGWRDEVPANLPVEWRAVLVLEDIVNGTIIQNLRAAEASLIAQPPSVDGAPLARLSGILTAAGSDFAFFIEFSCIRQGIGEALHGFVPHTLLGEFDPGFLCRLYLPSRPVARSSYRAIATGDTLLSGELDEGRLSLFLEVPDIARFRAELDTATGTLTIANTSGFERVMSDFDDEYGPLEPEAGSVYDQLPAADVAEELPIRIDFLIGTCRLNLAELRSLGPGATLSHNIDLTQPVTILANGAPAAKGYLVQIGDRVGVQISHWPRMGNGDG